MKIFILLLIIASLIGLYFMMKNERLYKWRNYMGIFFIVLPILFILSASFLPFIDWWSNNESATLFQFIKEASDFSKSNWIRISLIVLIIWMFLFGYIQRKRNSHWLGIYILSVFISSSVVFFIMNIADATIFISKQSSHINYPIIGYTSFFIIIFTAIAFILYSFIYTKEITKKIHSKQ